MIYLLAAGPHSGVKVDVEDSAGQKNSYCGYIEEIWEVNCGMSLQFHVFKCQRVKHPHGFVVDEYGFTILDFRNVGHKDEFWVLASTVAQAFYILDPKDEKKHNVVSRKQ
jgi:hypothetical protein